MRLSLRLYAVLLIELCFYTAQAQKSWLEEIAHLKKVVLTQPADTNRIRTLLTISDGYRFLYPDSALLYSQEALSLAEELDSDKHRFFSIVAISGSLYVLGDYPLQLDYALKAQQLNKKLNTPYTIGFSNGLLSDCYYNLGEYETSLKYWRNVVDICERTLPGELYSIYGNSSRIFAGMQRYDSALFYAKESYDLLLDRSGTVDPLGSRFDQSNIFTILGSAYAGSRQYDSALLYYRMALSASGDIKMEMNRIDDLIGIAKVYRDIGNFDSAIWYSKKAFSQKITGTYPIGKLNAATLLTELYEENKNFADSALKYMHVTLDVKNKLFSSERTIAFQNILFREREKQKDVQTATLKLQSEYRSYVLFGLLSVMMIIGGIFLRNRRVKQLQHIRNSIADDLHDDIGSALSSISIMSELARQKSPEAAPLLVSIGESTSVIQDNMSDIVWTIKARNDRFENVLVRMNQFASEILNSKGIELDFFSDPALHASRLNMDQRKNFYLFFKEVINNAAKYSEAKSVFVRITIVGHSIEMAIKDDGVGFNTSEVFDGNGMNSLRKRAAELKGDFTIISSTHSGTTVTLKFRPS